MAKEKIIYLTATQLLHHPRNMRRLYPDAQVAEMAASIQARGGVEQALIVVPGPERKYFVVDGNLRLEGAQRLGRKCPRLKCEVRSQAAADQLLTMAVTNRFRYRVDPISEAVHYQRLIQEEGHTPRTIARAVGVCVNTVDDLLLLLKLAPEIQTLIADGKLPKDARVARALLSLPREVGIRLAQQMAGGASIKAVLKAVEKLKETLSARPAHRGAGSQAPALVRARTRKARLQPDDPPALSQAGELPAATRPMPWPQMREQVRRTCQACQVKAETLDQTAEPAWALIAHAATDTCGDCSLTDIAAACDTCPLVDLLRRLARQAEPERNHAAPA
jgi:ParB family transcriptional regulator, chromosome partitioning protein